MPAAKKKTKRRITKKRLPGPPALLTKRVANAIFTHLANGGTQSGSAKAVGLNPYTVHHWIMRGRQATAGKYYIFAVGVDAAMEEAKEKLHEVVVASALGESSEVEVKETTDAKGKVLSRTTITRTRPNNPQLALRMLEARHPNEYGRRIIQNEGNPQGNQPIIQLVFNDPRKGAKIIDANDYNKLPDPKPSN